MTLFKRLICCLLFTGAVSSLSASLILLGSVDLSGTGLGAVNTVLTITSPGSSTIETGCVAPSGSGTTTLGCGFSNSQVQPQNGTPSLTAAGIAAASDLRIVFNASEPGSAPDIVLNNLVLTLYSGANRFSASLSPANGIFFPTTQPGAGNSGFVFAFSSPGLCAAIGGCPAGTDMGEAAAAQAFIVNNGGAGNVRLGLGASAGNAGGGAGSATGGPETFFVGSVNTTGGPRSAGDTVPEPFALLLIGSGLIGIVSVRHAMRVR
jgi:hypothetical protein